MASESHPLLKGEMLFRKNELVYVNKSNELQEFCNIVHKHDFIEITYVISGEGLHIMGNNEYEASKGDLFIINSEVSHGFFPAKAGQEAPQVYNVAFLPEFLDISLFSSVHFEDITSSFLFRSLFPEDYNPSPDLKLKGAEFNEIGEIFSKMYSEYKLMNKGYTDIIRAYLIELIIKIFRLIESSSKKPVTSKNREIIGKALDYLKSNYSSEIKLTDLAMKCFLSRNYFSRLFKEVTGINVSDYIQRLRIDEACSLLKNTDRKVVDISLHVGFKDLKFFYKLFKKYTGKTPSNYRRI